MKILLVDDDSALLEILGEAFKQLAGHEVRTAATGGAAIQAATAMGGVDLLISDVVMEPMNGFGLRDMILKRFPAARTIFISGFDLSDYPEETRNTLLVQKPFSPADLIKAAQKLLAPTPAVAVRAGQPAARPAVVSKAPPVPASPATEKITVPAAKPAAARPVARVGASAPAEDFNQVTARISLPPGINRPKAAAAPVAPPPPPPPPVETVQITPVAPMEPPQREMLMGATLGAYQIVSQIGEGRWGAVYAAVQISVNRPVGLKILDAHLAADPEQKARFIADARAKAHVQHPSILSVFEAGEIEGHSFYAHEFVEGHNLAELQAGGQKIEESTALTILRTVGEGLAYFQKHNLPHSALEAESIYLGVAGQPRVANLATQLADQQTAPAQEINALGRIILSVVSLQDLKPGLRALTGRMVQGGPNAITSWANLLQAVKALEPKVVPVEAAKISAQDRAAIQAVEAARRLQKRSLWLTVATMSGSLLIVGWLVWYFFHSNERNLDASVPIPAGDYLVGDSKSVHLDAFWIDKYEVTLGQYAKFLEYLEAHPTAEADFNHERQPRQLDHRPKDWNIYYQNALRGSKVAGVTTTLNSPMLMATWWDAYAYAKWRGRELPTEQEWEAAARGPKGLLYPWGNEPAPKKANTNADFDARHPEVKGSVDGFSWWCDVDEFSADKSPLGVIGMGGNVSEWVDWPRGSQFPVYKGGNFKMEGGRLDIRVADHHPGKGEEFIGFRTISRTPPTK